MRVADRGGPTRGLRRRCASQPVGTARPFGLVSRMSTTMTSAPTGIDCHMYTADDVRKARDFYRDVVGLPVTREFMDGAFVEFDLPDGSTFALGPIRGERIACSGIMFAVPDVAAATERVRAAGGAVHAELFETPVCHISVCADPSGNTFIFHKSKSA